MSTDASDSVKLFVPGQGENGMDQEVMARMARQLGAVRRALKTDNLYRAIRAKQMRDSVSRRKRLTPQEMRKRVREIERAEKEKRRVHNDGSKFASVTIYYQEGAFTAKGIMKKTGQTVTVRSSYPCARLLRRVLKDNGFENITVTKGALAAAKARALKF